MPYSKPKDDFTIITARSRLLALEMKHGFIDCVHLFLAMLKETCLAGKYLQAIDAEVLDKQIRDLYPANGTQTIKDDFALTVWAERTVKHAYTIARINEQRSINSIHLLLAILSFEDKTITGPIERAGILIEDITEDYFKKKIKKFSAPFDVIRAKTYNKVEIFLLEITGKKNKKIQQIYETAVALYYYYQFEDVTKICETGLSLSPGDLSFKNLIACGKYKSGDYQSALKLIDELIENRPDSDNINYEVTKAYIYDIIGNHDKSAVILDKLLAMNPDDKELLNHKGFNLSKQEQYTESIPFFEKAIAMDATASFTLNNLGFSKFKLGDVNGAMALIDKSLALHKGNAYAYKNKGIILMEQGNNEDALQNFDLALKFGYTEKYGDEVLQLIKQIN